MHTIILSLRNVAYSFNSDFNIILGIKLFSLSVLSLVLISCGGGGGGGGVSDGDSSDTTPSTPVESLTLHSSNQAANNQFGETVVQLPNGNIVVAVPNDSSRVENGGAVYLYDPSLATPIDSIFGDTEDDQLGGDGITVLSNSNFVIVSKFDDENNITNAGSVRLVSGTTGKQIDAVIGDAENDSLGSYGITVLGNGHFVIVSESDDENGITNAGSVRLINGETGKEIDALVGDVKDDFLGDTGITVLSNNNFIVASALDNENGTTDTGSIRLVSGTTGKEIGDTLVGDAENDFLGDNSITVLGNNNFVVTLRLYDDDENNITDAGSVRLINGTTGKQIGTALVGDAEYDRLGNDGVTVLSNNNFVIVSEYDDNGSITDAGSVRLVDGKTGIEIKALVGDVAHDKLGGSGVTALGNGHFVIASRNDNENSTEGVGSVRLINGETGVQIGALIGDAEYDWLGNNGITVLNNNNDNNFVVASAFDDENNVTNAGSVRLVSGTTGDQIGIALVGDAVDEQLGSSDNHSITALSNGHFVVVSTLDDSETGTTNVGSVRLINGITGDEIKVLTGDEANDKLGSGGITALNNDNFVIVSALDDEGGIINAGSVRLVDGTTGVQIGDAVVGDTANDIENAQVIAPKSGDYYILGLPKADVDGSVDAGSVRIVVPQ